MMFLSRIGGISVPAERSCYSNPRWQTRRPKRKQTFLSRTSELRAHRRLPATRFDFLVLSELTAKPDDNRSSSWRWHSGQAGVIDARTRTRTDARTALPTAASDKGWFMQLAATYCHPTDERRTTSVSRASWPLPWVGVGALFSAWPTSHGGLASSVRAWMGYSHRRPVFANLGDHQRMYPCPLAEGPVQAIRPASILIATDGTRATGIGLFRGGIWLRCI